MDKYSHHNTGQIRSGRIYKISLFFLLVLFLLTSVYAWSERTQHQSTGFFGRDGSGYLTIILNKYEKDRDGVATAIPVSGAEFYLYAEDGSSIGGPYYTDDYGQIIIQTLVLEAGVYYFQETDPGDGFMFDQTDGEDITRYYFTVTGEKADETAVVTAYNRRRQGSLKICKQVENVDGSSLSPEQLKHEFAFSVSFSDGRTYQGLQGSQIVTIEGSGTFLLRHGEEAIFEGLPVGTGYQVTELPAAGYQTVYKNEEGTIDDGVTEVIVTNTQSLDIILRKYERDVIGNTTQKPVAGAVFNLHREDDTLLAGPLVTKQDGTITIDRLSLPAGRYYFQEVKPAESYMLEPAADVLAGRYYFEIDYYKDVEPIEIIAYNQKTAGELVILKEVENADGSELTEEQEAMQFAFEVSFSDGGTYSYLLGGAEHQLASGSKLYLRHGEKAWFQNLPIGVGYQITEEEIGEYFVTSENHSGVISEKVSEAAFVNVYAPVPVTEFQNIKIRKTVEGEVPPELADQEFHFTLTVDGEKTEFTLKAGEEKEFTVPYGAKYEVFEKDTEGFTKKELINGYGTAGDTLIEVEQINEWKEPKEETVELEGIKIWQLDGYEGELPDEVKLYIKNGSETAAVAYARKDQEWKWSVSLPKYEADGTTEIQYTVAEEPVAGFKSTVNGTEITNTYLPVSPVSVTIPVKKKIEGTPDRKEDYTFVLEGLTEQAPLPAESNGGRKPLVISGAGEKPFDEIRFEKEGIYRYRLSEVKGNNAACTYDSAVYVLNFYVTLNQETRSLDYEVAIVRNRSLQKDNVGLDELIFINTYTPVEPGETPNPKDPDKTPKPADPAKKTDPKDGSESKQAAKTGDSAVLFLWYGSLILSIVCLIGIVRQRQRSRGFGGRHRRR